MTLQKGLAWVLLLLLLLTTFSGCSEGGSQTEPQQFNTIEDLAGKRIGVVTGMIFDRVAEEKIPDCEVSYFTNYADTAEALSTGKIEAFIADEPIARKLVLTHPGQKIMTKVMDDSYGFVFPKDNAHKKLCEEMNAFLKTIREDGTIEEIDGIWFGSDELVQTIDRTSFTGENGSVKFITSTSAGDPFVFVKNGETVGYEVDIFYRFCRAYGYIPELVDSNFTGILASISSGKGDIGASCISITDERKESMLFSDPHYVGGAVIVTNDGTPKPSEPQKYSSASQLAGKKIGVVTGTIFDGVAEERISDPEISYFNADPDLPIALESGKIDAYIVDEPIFRSFSRNYPKQYQVEHLTSEAYGYIFPKNSARHETICRQFNEFLSESWKNGTMNEIAQKWLEGNPNTATTNVDYSDLTGENGVLHYATCTESAVMFDMRMNGGYGGYEIDLLVRFCRAYGYRIEITDYSFSGLLMAVSTGKEDIGGCTITITDERKENILFSEPNYYGGSVLVATQCRSASDLTLSDMDGKRIGVVTGSVFDLIAKEKLPGGQIEYFNAMSDAATALQAGKIDGYLADEPIYRSISRSYPQEYVIGQLTYEDYAFLFPKDSEKHRKICTEMNAFLAEKWNDGTIGELCAKWIDGDYSKASIDMSGLTGEKGTLKMGISSDIGAPFTFVQNGVFAGYDIEIIVRFCREYGYALEINDYAASGLLSAISTGAVDIAAGCVSITEERQESMLFSDPDYHGGVVLIGSHSVVNESSSTGFLAGIKESFTKTFIREQRWKLFLAGIGVTLFITALSVVFGTALGFLFFLLYRKNYKSVNAVIDVIKDILEKTPVVVILMILYYLVFGRSDLSGVLVSVIGFSLMFAFSLVGTLKVGVMAVDKGQREASLALGFTDLRSFFKVILPQAAKHFLPGYKGQIVSLLKDTAIVGYIAVQDLTKVSDIVRSRTYEAFFPLIATAILYFLLAWLLTLLVRSIELKTDSKNRSKKKILKGVKTN